MRRLRAGIVLLSAATACNSSGAPPSAPTGAAAPVTTVALEGGPVASVAAADPPASPTSSASAASPSGASNATGPSDGGGDFYACNVDSDCVAVPKVGCCPTGHQEAVNKQSVSSYESSFVCEMKRRICPMYRILDKRQPLCGSTSHKCEMVSPEQIACGGTGSSSHACLGGFRCDSGGHCKPSGANP
jgi:hypothetical protein